MYTKKELLDGFCLMTKYDGSMTKKEWFQAKFEEKKAMIKKQMKNNVIRFLNMKNANDLVKEHEGIELD